MEVRVRAGLILAASGGATRVVGRAGMTTDGTPCDGAPTAHLPFGPYLGYESSYRGAESPERGAESGTPAHAAGTPAPDSGYPAPDGGYGPHPGGYGQYAPPPARYAAPPGQYAAPPAPYPAPPGEYRSPPSQHPSPEGPYPAVGGQQPSPDGQYPPGGPGTEGSRPGAARPRRVLRWLRRILTAGGVLILLLALVFTVLLLVTPSVGNAPALARAMDRAHHAVYPGPPVPPRFAAALTSTEDHRFYSEPGIDPFAVARVIIGRITGGPDQGGATLYQQLAKMLYTPRRSGLTAQMEQIVLGIKLDMTYSKSKILQMYADVVYFGHGYYGLAAASCGYFRKPPAQLSWAQAALLAGLVQAPAAYDPLAHYASARARQAHVLSRLVATGTLSQARASWAYRRPLHLVGGPAAGCAAG